MFFEFITEGSEDIYHAQFRPADVIEKKGATIASIFATVEDGAEVAKIDKTILDVNKNINVWIQGLAQGLALIHVKMFFTDSTVETLCIKHRGVNC